MWEHEQSSVNGLFENVHVATVTLWKHPRRRRLTERPIGFFNYAESYLAASRAKQCEGQILTSQLSRLKELFVGPRTMTSLSLYLPPLWRDASFFSLLICREGLRLRDAASRFMRTGTLLLMRNHALQLNRRRLLRRGSGADFGFRPRDADRPLAPTPPGFC